MNAHAPIARIVGLIRRLASENDNEALAALHALRRTLKSIDGDLNDIAEIVAANIAPKADQTIVTAPRREWLDRVAWLLTCHDCLSSKEFHFLRGLRGGKYTPTDKQLKWLGQIYAREQRRAR
jgi:hypothetical protein